MGDDQNSPDEEIDYSLGLPDLNRKHESLLKSPEKSIDLFNSGRWSDFTIKCKDISFKVHRIFLHGHSAFLDKALDGPFSESKKKELDLSQEEPAVISMVLWFMYTGNINHTEWRQKAGYKVDKDDDYMLLLVKIIRVTDFLMMSELKSVARYILTKCLKRLIAGGTATSIDQDLPAWLSEVVSYVFIDEGNLIEVKKLMAWALGAMNDIRKRPQLITNSKLDTLIDLNPGLGKYLCHILREQVELSQIVCWMCQKPSEHWNVERFLYIEHLSPRKHIGCVCGFRGLCNTNCLVKDREVLRHNTLCLKHLQIVPSYCNEQGQRIKFRLSQVAEEWGHYEIEAFLVEEHDNHEV